ncbi:hypothetical protein JOD52_001088 [Brachybacterium muris]|nr:hypothetical protein [Brachybacterium muris]
MVLQLPAAADDEALLRNVEAVERTTGDVVLLEDRDVGAGNPGVADQEDGRREPGEYSPRWGPLIEGSGATSLP